MRHQPLLLVVTVLGFATAAPAGEPVTIPKLLAEMVDRDRPARLPAVPFRCLQASSYDRRRPTPPIPRRGSPTTTTSSSSAPKPTRGGRNGSSWSTRGRAAWSASGFRCWGTRKNQVVRFYFDGAKTPGLAVKFNELLSGRGFVKPPYAFVASDEKTTEGVAGDLYLPIPFAKGCKITLDSTALLLRDQLPGLRAGDEA